MVSKGVKGLIGLVVAVISLVWLVSGTMHYMGDMKKYDNAQAQCDAKLKVIDQAKLALDQGDQAKADELTAQYDSMPCNGHI